MGNEATFFTRNKVPKGGRKLTMISEHTLQAIQMLSHSFTLNIYYGDTTSHPTPLLKVLKALTALVSSSPSFASKAAI